MTNSSCPKEDSVKQVLVSITSVTKCLSGMEEERQLDALLNTLLLEPEQFWKKVFEWSTWVLLANEVITRH